MMKKKYIPNRYICYLYFLVPLILNAVISYSSNEDIWYIMRYGKMILQHGFIHTDILSMHNNLHIVIQQAFSNIIFYLIYHLFGSYGLFLLCEIMIALYLFIIYKICMLLSNKKVLLSVLIATITCILLESNFITPRPQIFTYLNLLLVIYIMERFYKENNTKLVYFLPLISLIQINLHAALWCSIFLFILPYMAQMIIEKNKQVYKIIIIMILMFFVGFINPYTYENVFFPFTSYDASINEYILELQPLNIISNEKSVALYSISFYLILAIILAIYIYYKKGKLELRHLFLLGGTTILAIMHVRSIPLFLIASLPPLANYLKTMSFKVKNDYIDTKKCWIAMIIIILVIAGLNPNRLESEIKNGGDYLKKHYNKNIIIYTSFNHGSYIEYLGFHPYFDTRAEVFLKKANKRVDIFNEAVEIEKNCNGYKEFINKYKFTHMIVYKNSCLYYYLQKDKKKKIFEEDNYAIFELKYN